MADQGFIIGDRVVSHVFETHPEWCAAYGRRADFTVVGASAVGRLHLRDGRGREDSFLIRSRGDWVLASVADGLGSARLGAAGSSLAVGAFSEYFLGSLPSSPGQRTGPKPKFVPLRRETGRPQDEAGEEYGSLIWFRENRDSLPGDLHRPETLELTSLARQAIEQTRSIIAGWAQRSRVEIADCASTLVGFLVNTRNGLCFSVQVGDGAVVGVRNDQSKLIIEPRLSGEVGETPVITQQDWGRWMVSHTTNWKQEAFHTVLIMTDGVSDDCLYGPPDDILNSFSQDMAQELRRSIRPDRSARKLVRWLSQYRSRSSWDDRTLIAVFQ